MGGPRPQFSPREIFTDHNFAGDAFLQGLGNANLSPVADVVDGVKQGLAIGGQISNIIRENSPEAAEARRIALETDRLNLEANKYRNQRAGIQARRDAATEASALAREEAENIAATQQARDDLVRSQNKTKAYETLGQIEDPYSFIETLKNPALASLAGDKEIAAQVESKASRIIAQSKDPNEQVEIIKASQALAPGSISRLSILASPEAQKQLLDPIKREQLDYYDARTDATRNRANSLESSGVLSKGALQLVDNTINSLGGDIPPGAEMRLNKKGEQVVAYPKNVTLPGGEVKTKMEEIPIKFTGKDGPAAIAELQRRVREANPQSTSDPVKIQKIQKQEAAKAFTYTQMEQRLYESKWGEKKFTEREINSVVSGRINGAIKRVNDALIAKGEKPLPDTAELRTRIAAVLRKEFVEDEFYKRARKDGVID